MTFYCPQCSKPYKRESAFNKHIEACKKDNFPKKKVFQKKRRRALGSELRIQVWETYIGQNTQGLCFCCWNSEYPIRPFSYSNTFQAGHIISRANGGKDAIENLLPICRDCNMNMSAENWDDYIERQPHLSLRTYGENPPKKVIWATTVIQSLVRMWIERKNPNSEWRLNWERQNFKN